MQALQNLVVPAGTPFSGYLAELRILVATVRCHVSREDGTMKIAINTGLDDHFPSLSALVFAGRNTRSMAFDGVEDFDGFS